MMGRRGGNGTPITRPRASGLAGEDQLPASQSLAARLDLLDVALGPHPKIREEAVGFLLRAEVDRDVLGRPIAIGRRDERARLDLAAPAEVAGGGRLQGHEETSVRRSADHTSE